MLAFRLEREPGNVNYRSAVNTVSSYGFFLINPFIHKARFLYPLKNIRKGFLMFLGLEKGCTGNKWVK